MSFPHTPHGLPSGDSPVPPALEAVRHRVEERALLSGHRMTAYTHTFGCQQNVADTERLRGQLDAMGFDLTEDREQADLILINTCAVREHAESRALSYAGTLAAWKSGRPDRILALCGCMAQRPEISSRIKSSFKHIDILFGTHALRRFPALLERYFSEGRRVFDTEEDDAAGGLDEWSDHGAAPLRAAPPRAWVPVMSGCNNFCSYCIVPYVRGRERSRPAGGIADEVRTLIEQGYKEITLLGQNVNSYRDPSSGNRVTGFPELLRMLCQADGDYLVSFMTSHPKDCTPELLDAVGQLPHMAKKLHLPVQSGSDSVLKAMNRGYTAAHYMSIVERARASAPGLSVTSDIIVGFPGETERDFEDTLRLVERVRFDMLFTFLYSARRGTPAALLPGLSREVKQKRFERLLELQDSIASDRR